MGRKEKELSQSEIWDDSALIESWNDALDEYKLYHSIHARGERLEDVLSAAQNQEDTAMDGLPSEKGEVFHTNGFYAELEEGELEEGELEDDISTSKDSKLVDEPRVTQVPPLEQGTSGVQQQAQPVHRPHTMNVSHEATAADPLLQTSSMPAAVIEASSEDAATKNIMMSWYWVGYYTGLYEGQRKAATAVE